LSTRCEDYGAARFAAVSNERERCRALKVLPAAASRWTAMTEVGFYPSRRVKKRGTDPIAFPGQVPLVATIVILFVVLFLSEASSSSVHHGASVDLAAVRNPVLMPSANRGDAIKVALTRDGTIYFQNTKITIEHLPEQIRTCTKKGSERRAYLSVDARARYSDVKAVLEGVRAAGIGKVALLTEKQRE